MVSWKIALVVIAIAILVVAMGMWFGYQYVSEKDDTTPVGWRKPSNTADSHGYKSFVRAHGRENPAAAMLSYCRL